MSEAGRDYEEVDMACNQRFDDEDLTRFEEGSLTLGDLVSAVIEVSESEREAVAVVVHLIESGRVRALHPKKASKKARRRQRAREAALRKTA
jgi:hypothetical protein